MANFAWALNQLQTGNSVRRNHWKYNDKSASHLMEVTFNGFAPCLVQYNTFPDGSTDKYPGALLDYEDMVAGDWEIV
jgi:hypothetical protein